MWDVGAINDANMTDQPVSYQGRHFFADIVTNRMLLDFSKLGGKLSVLCNVGVQIRVAMQAHQRFFHSEVDIGEIGQLDECKVHCRPFFLRGHGQIKTRRNIEQNLMLQVDLGDSCQQMVGPALRRVHI